LEIELRAKVADFEALENKLCLLSARFQGEREEYDQYFGPEDRKMIVRIRNRNGVSFLTFKSLSQSTEVCAWQEWETKIEDADALEKILSNGLKRLVEIRKKRKTYALNDFEINLDRIQDLGNFIEVELISENIPEAKKRLEKFLKELEISEERVVREGYVQLMMKNRD